MRNDEKKDEKIISKLYESQTAKSIIDDIASFNKTLDSVEPPVVSDRVLKDIKLKLERELKATKRRKLFKARLIKIAAMVIIAIGLSVWSMIKTTHYPRDAETQSYSLGSIWQETSDESQIEKSITMIENELLLPNSSSDSDIYDSELYYLEGEIETLNTTLWKG